MGKRIALKQFRVGLQLTQQEMADKLNISRGKYVAIENGSRNGDFAFWRTFQKTFNLSGGEVWDLQEPISRSDSNA